MVVRPDKKTLCASLEGTKRIRDLGQVRWILVKMVRCGKEGGDPNKVDAEIDDEVSMDIFNMYAAHTLPHLWTLVGADQSKAMEMGDTFKNTVPQRSQLVLPLRGPKLIRFLRPPRVLS